MRAVIIGHIVAAYLEDTDCADSAADLAEHLGLRSRDQLLGWIAAGGLEVIERHDTRPVHPRATDADDPLHAARSQEVTSLWRLRSSAI